MRKSRKRKLPVTTDSSSGSSKTGSSHPHSSRTLIRRFHVLLKRRSALLQSTTAHGETALREVEREIEALGGLPAYQRMSTIGQGDDRGGGSEKRLIAWLTEMGCSRGRSGKLRLLEVGALKTDNYRSCLSWIDATPIDLRSQHPSIREQDFLLMDPVENAGRWDVISLSLVLNFVPLPGDRGRMLRLAHDMLTVSGLLFLVLPFPCVENSRYLTFDHLEALMRVVGFKQLRVEWKKEGRMAYWLYQKLDGDTGSRAPLNAELFKRKTVLKQGNRNNFCIVL